jgi:hypothetical protein
MLAALLPGQSSEAQSLRTVDQSFDGSDRPDDLRTLDQLLRRNPPGLGTGATHPYTATMVDESLNYH